MKTKDLRQFNTALQPANDLLGDTVAVGLPAQGQPGRPQAPGG
jgi:hypothetical protein